MRQKEAYKRELYFLQKVSHSKSILAMLAYNDNEIFILFNAYDCDLLQFLLNDNNVLNKHQTMTVALNLQDALSYCHSQGIVHNDVKCENVLLKNCAECQQGDDISKCGAVLCDFSRAFEMATSQYDTLIVKKFQATYAYAAPENIEDMAGCPSDAWGMGLILFCMVERELPFDLVPHPTAKNRYSRL